MPADTISATILLIEDDPGDQALTRRAFEESHVKSDLRIVEDGEEALDYLLQQNAYADKTSAPRPDLVLLDLNLPKLDGKQVLERMRAHADLRRIPVVALTTSKQEEDILRTYDLGVNSYITKPVDIADFISALQDLGNYWFRLVALPSKCED